MIKKHLWRAGWQRGIAQWGILGQGNEWAAVAGGYGGRSDDRSHVPENDNKHLSQRSKLSFFASTIRGTEGRKAIKEETRKTDYYGHSLVLVRNSRGGQILIDDPALAAWAVDAIRVVRDQLYSAGSGTTPLPYYENWPREKKHFSMEDSAHISNIDWREITKGGSIGDSILSIDATDLFEDKSNAILPSWATEDFKSVIDDEVGIFIDTREAIDSNTTSIPDHTSSQNEKVIRTGDIKICNLALMVSEVNEILDTMELRMEAQRQRRLNKLKPPSRLVRNWYILAVGIPSAAYIAYQLLNNNATGTLARGIIQKMTEFCNEHISGPLISM